MAVRNFWASGPWSSITTAVGACPPLIAKSMKRSRKFTGMTIPSPTRRRWVRATLMSLRMTARTARRSPRRLISVPQLSAGETQENLFEAWLALGDAAEPKLAGHERHHGACRRVTTFQAHPQHSVGLHGLGDSRQAAQSEQKVGCRFLLEPHLDDGVAEALA